MTFEEGSTEDQKILSDFPFASEEIDSPVRMTISNQNYSLPQVLCLSHYLNINFAPFANRSFLIAKKMPSIIILIFGTNFSISNQFTMS